VSSEAQKDFLLRAVAAQMGDSVAPGEINVLVANDNDKLSQTVQMIVDENAVLYAAGEPEIKLVDLRDAGR
jgi:hypothetical protein